MTQWPMARYRAIYNDYANYYLGMYGRTLGMYGRTLGMYTLNL